MKCKKWLFGLFAIFISIVTAGFISCDNNENTVDNGNPSVDQGGDTSDNGNSNVDQGGDTSDNGNSESDETLCGVSFDTDGGSIVESQWLEKGSKIDEPLNPEKRGYDFEGWYYAGKKWSFADGIVTEKIELTAKWKMLESMEIFDFNSTATTCYVNGVKDKSLSEIVVPDCVTAIRNEAFLDCNNLTDVRIGKDVQTIEEDVFWICATLTTIYVAPDNLYYQSIDGNLYDKESKTLISYPRGKVEKTFKLPDAVTSIGNFAFYLNQHLTSVEMGNKVETIGDFAFANCVSLHNINIVNGVKTIGKSAFADCDGLMALELPHSVVSIGEHIFSTCDSLTRVEIGAGVQTIGSRAFAGCRYLTEINVSPNNVTFKSLNGNLYDKDGVTLIRYAIGKDETSFVIPDGVKTIGEYAFSLGGFLRNLEIGDEVEIISDYAFSSCSKLDNVIIPDNVRLIGDYAFTRCAALKNLVIGTDIESIGDYAFIYSEKLTNVYYRGTKNDWTVKIAIGMANESLCNATRYYYIENLTDLPTDGGNYWRYVDGVPTAW